MEQIRRRRCGLKTAGRGLCLFAAVAVMLLLGAGLSAQDAAGNDAHNGGRGSLTPDDMLKDAEAAFAYATEKLAESPSEAEAGFRRAALYYDSVINAGVENAGLYYNAANARFRSGELGYAVLNYRKALLFEPGNRQILSNLDYARSMQKNDFEDDGSHEILSIVLFLHRLIPSWMKAAAAAAANILFFLFLALMIVGRRTGRLSAAALIAVLVFGTSFFFDYAESKQLHGVIVAEETVGRLGDSRSYEAAFDSPLFEGLEFRVKQQRVGWLLAELPGGGLVWLPEAACGLVEKSR